MKEILNCLLNINKPIYIAGHIKPDQDSICSSLALALFLNKLNKKVKVLFEEKDLYMIEWFNDTSLITNKIDENDYCFISLDLNEKKRLGIYESYFDNASYTINIDHHQDNKYEANKTLSNTNSSSTCEIIYQLIENYDIGLLDQNICECLYSGILNDTNCFTRRLSPSTLTITQNLINQGIDYTYIIKKTFSQRTMYEFKALAKLINEIKYDEFHYAIIDKKDETYSNLTHNQIVKKLAEDLRQIEGIDIFVIFIKENDSIIAKCMSNISENANIIASLFGGGGHKKEAGFTIKNKDIDTIIKEIKTYIKNG